MNRIEWPDTGEVEFHPPAGVLIAILRNAGFEIERLVDLYAPDSAETHGYYGYVTRRLGAEVAGGGDLGRPQARRVARGGARRRHGRLLVHR